MKRKWNWSITGAACLLAVLMPLALSACAGTLKTETIIIPDGAEETPAAIGGDAFEIDALYRLPNGDAKYAGLFQWIGNDELIRVTWGFKGDIIVDKYKTPFEKAERVREMDGYLLDIGNMSTDGRYLIGYSYSEDAGQESALTLVSLESGEEKEVSSLRTVLRMGSRSITWSGDSAYFSFFTFTEQGELGIGAYHMESGSIKTYRMPEPSEIAFYYSVKLSEDGKSAIVIKEEKGKPQFFVLGKLEEGEFIPQYEHTMHQNGSVDWIDQDRVAFTGSDGTLFAYDLRNDGYAVLLDQVGNFALSQDRSFIAYSTPDATVEVAKLQGNNLLHKTTVYRGIVADGLTWSPDGGSLLIQGRKPYDDAAALQPVAKEAEAVDDYSFQQIVIDFRS
ncbi:hypothetical protein PAT3040_01437 [Paenibacillus agaridevorans]|uniref:WD40 repeat domain-containing protein n=1 Tax=Paenibacillus agaridevorans TaxID=171404 RepID=A0A2R5ELB9_9BACL|nr:hypothetical protein [Paenibacillus agaridevorans]GBG06895.1 hypothetical protein PAT3040_01437 [Paenibacillus agaridevorans]